MIERFDIAHDSYNPTFNFFREHHRNLYREARTSILTHVGSRKPIIVDAACGYGHGYEYLGDLGDYVGLDCSWDAIKICKDRYPLGNYQLADLEYSPILQALAPQVIVSFETAEHLSDPAAFIRRVRKSLAPNGLFLFSAPTSLTMDFDPFHHCDWPAATWCDLLRASNFRIACTTKHEFESTFGQFLGTVPTTWWQKGRILRFLLTHGDYLRDRLYNWGWRNRFYWSSHLFVCEPRDDRDY